MLKNTNMEKIKEIAKCFLYFDLKINENLPMIANHPFTDSPYFYCNGNLYDLSKKENFLNFTKEMEIRINNVDNYVSFSTLITKPYRSAFFKYTKKYINQYDLSKYLKSLWLGNDYVNVDANISKKEYVKLFKQCDPKYLMDEEEYKFFINLPEKIIVYRGINQITKHPVKALSWTIDIKRAEWFARRFEKNSSKTGKVYKTIIKKDYALAYFEYEKEIVVDFTKLEDIEEV